MKKYTNDTRKSPITHYEIGEEFIRVKFRKALIEYDNQTHSKIHVDKMKTLAKSGEGLSRYITKNVATGRRMVLTEPTKFLSFKSFLSMLLLFK